ncbi:MAG: class I SAM-dependent methyltransferase, partial [Acinetobacter sp.]
MSSENQKPTPQTESATNTDKVSPFLTEPLPQGTPQGQQQSLQQQSVDTPVSGTVPKYNLPRGANTGNVGATTHFGYQTVSSEDKAQKVAEVFHSVASKYDIMNDLMSFGIHRLWKRFAINMSGVRRGQRVLDIAGGTGDLAKVFSREVGPTGHVVLSDINESMLNVGRDRLIDAGCTNV